MKGVLKVLMGVIGLPISTGIAGFGLIETPVGGFQKGLWLGLYLLGFLAAIGSFALIGIGVCEIAEKESRP